MSKKEDREFALELSKVQMKHQDISSTALSVIAVETSILAPLGLTFLAFGLSSGSNLLSIYSCVIFLALGMLYFWTLRYFGGKKTREEIEINLEREVAPIRKKFIDGCIEPTKKAPTERIGECNSSRMEKRKKTSKWGDIYLLYHHQLTSNCCNCICNRCERYYESAHARTTRASSEVTRRPFGTSADYIQLHINHCCYTSLFRF